MPLNGTGTYTPPSPEFPAVPGDIIYADYFNTIILDIATALSNAVYVDGQAAMEANLPMGGFKLTSLGTATASGHAVEYAQWIASFANPLFTTTTAGGGLRVTGDLVNIDVALFDIEGSTEARFPAVSKIGGNQIASQAWATALAWQTALPSQTGNKGKFVTTDGSTASWAVAGFELATLGGGTLSGNKINGILTSGTYTLPNLATDSTAAFAVSCLSNAASVPTTITTSDGWTVATNFTLGTEETIAPYSRATAHGMWGAYAMTPPTLDTETLTAVSAVLGSVMMPNNVLVMGLKSGGSTHVYLYAIDLVNNVIGAGLQLSTTSNSTDAFYIFKESATTMVAFFDTASGGNPQVRAVSLSGTTLTAGTIVQISTSSVKTYTPPIQLAEGGAYLISLASGLIHACTCSGTTMTVGTAFDAEAGTGTFSQVWGLAKVSTTTALIAGVAEDGIAGAEKARAQVLSVSGVTITANTAVEAAAASLVNGDTTNIGLIPFSTSDFLLFGTDNTIATTTNFYNINVSGTTPSFGALTQSTTNTPASYTPTTFAYAPANQWLPYSSTQILCGSLAGGYVITRSGSTITIGASGQLAGQTTGTFQRDYGQTTLFFVGSSAFDVFTVGAGVLTSSEQVSAIPTNFFTATVNNKTNKYSGSWYTWTISLTMAVATDKAIYINGTTLSLYGNIS